VLALWGRQGFLEDHYDVLEVWRGWAEKVRGRVLECGHYLPEEVPEETYAELREFFGAQLAAHLLRLDGVSSEAFRCPIDRSS